jgi:hypothetical protein
MTATRRPRCRPGLMHMPAASAACSRHRAHQLCRQERGRCANHATADVGGEAPCPAGRWDTRAAGSCPKTELADRGQTDEEDPHLSSARLFVAGNRRRAAAGSDRAPETDGAGGAGPMRTARNARSNRPVSRRIPETTAPLMICSWRPRQRSDFFQAGHDARRLLDGAERRRIDTPSSPSSRWWWCGTAAEQLTDARPLEVPALFFSCQVGDSGRMAGPGSRAAPG